jgi:hypothetical protein
MKILRLPFSVACAFAACAMGGHAFAQSTAASSGASITIENGLNLTAIRPLIFAAPTDAARRSVLTPGSPAVIEISGDPGRLYRIRLPDFIATDGGAVIENLTVVSEMSGDVSRTLIARMNAEGHDRLFIGGKLRRPKALAERDRTVAVIPVQVDYE